MLNSETQLDENGLLQVEFRHNNQGDTYSERLWGIVSYTLESILIMMSLNVRDLRLSMTAGQTVVQNG